METRAAGLRLEALQHMTIAMAGVDCKEFFTLITTFFGHGTSFADNPFGYLNGAPTIRPPLDLTDTDTNDESGGAGSCASEGTPASTSVPGPVDILEPKEPKVKSKPKMQYTDRVPDIANTKGFFPLDKDSLHNTGIPSTHLVKRTGLSGKG